MIRCLLMAGLGLLGALAPWAARAADDGTEIDARYEGYARPVLLNEGSVGLTWLLLIALALLCAGVMFKNAKRTHMD